MNKRTSRFQGIFLRYIPFVKIKLLNAWHSVAKPKQWSHNLSHTHTHTHTSALAHCAFNGITALWNAVFYKPKHIQGIFTECVLLHRPFKTRHGFSYNVTNHYKTYWLKQQSLIISHNLLGWLGSAGQVYFTRCSWGHPSAGCWLALEHSRQCLILQGLSAHGRSRNSLHKLLYSTKVGMQGGTFQENKP